MPAYLKFYQLDHSAFDAESQSKIVLGTKALRDALAAVRSGLADGATRICVNGGAGMGKTSLARALPKLLDDGSRVAVVLRPSASWNSMRSSIAKQWKVGEGGLSRSNLVSFAHQARLVLVVDQAESASTDLLDHLDVLLSYRTEDDRPVVQSVLFANLAAQSRTDPPPLIWWLDRIQTLELQFAPLPREGVGSYIHKHLKRAGWKKESLFSAEAAHAIHGYTGGIPGEVDRVCELLLNSAAERNLHSIEADLVHELLDAQADASTSTYDTFEELVMEDEFVGAEATETLPPEPTPSLQQTLEHFANDAQPSSSEAGASPDGGALASEGSSVDGGANADGVGWPLAESDTEAGDPAVTSPDRASRVDPESAGSAGDDSLEGPETGVDDADSLHALEAYLSQPPSEEELRALARGRWRLPPRPIGLAAVAFAVAAAMLIWFGGDDPSTEVGSTAASTARVTPPLEDPSPPTIFASPDGLSVLVPDDEATRPLARLRGPVAEPIADTESARETDSNADPKGAPAPPAANAPAEAVAQPTVAPADDPATGTAPRAGASAASPASSPAALDGSPSAGSAR